MSTENPFTQVHTALWTMAEGCKALTDLIAVGNRIKYSDNTDRDPEKRNVSAADLPELMLTSTAVEAQMNDTSTTSFVSRRFSWIITTGDLRLNKYLLEVEWALFVALHGWQTVLGGLRFHGESFVKRAQLLDIENGVLRPAERTDGPTGWAAVWGVRIDMQFNTRNLLAIRSQT